VLSPTYLPLIDAPPFVWIYARVNRVGFAFFSTHLDSAGDAFYQGLARLETQHREFLGADVLADAKYHAAHTNQGFKFRSFKKGRPIACFDQFESPIPLDSCVNQPVKMNVRVRSYNFVSPETKARHAGLIVQVRAVHLLRKATGLISA
jgi:hypothetical protein